jgi:hypothetical protein
MASGTPPISRRQAVLGTVALASAMSLLADAEGEASDSALVDLGPCRIEPQFSYNLEALRHARLVDRPWVNPLQRLTARQIARSPVT